MKTIHLLACAATLALTPAAFAQGTALPSADLAEPAFKVGTADFAKTVMSSNQFEIQSSEMAGEKAESPDVKSFATQMIADHEKAGEALKTALGGNAPGGAMLAPKHAKMLQQLEAANGADFQALYIDMQAQAHREAVALFRTYAGGGEDAKVKAFAQETLPVLEGHMEHVQALVAASN